MAVISCWSIEDREQGRVDVARELVTVWAVHFTRCLRLIVS
jgi:hypothetical protein